MVRVFGVAHVSTSRSSTPVDIHCTVSHVILTPPCLKSRLPHAFCMTWTKMPSGAEVCLLWRFGVYVTLFSALAWGTPMECPKWWHFYEERQLCFLVSTTPPLSWGQARDMCKSYGGDLTTIFDAKTNTFVKGLIKSSREEYWIGLHDTVTENVFQWLDEDSEANFTNWAPNQPNNMDNEDCVLISAKTESQWNDGMCSAQLGFSCQRAAVPATKPIEECPKGWHFYKERKQCFLFDPTPPLSWEQARDMCRFYGADLTTIPDSETNAFVEGLIKSSCEEYWIGLHDTVTENVFQWLDEDSEANFTNWAPNEPNDMDNEDCVFISAKNESQWNDGTCTAEIGYSCQRASASNYEASTPQAVDACPKGWHFYEERQQCFLLDPKPPLSWGQARHMCRSYGGHLTTIPDAKTNTFVMGLIKSSLEEYWIGLRDSAAKDVFQWSDEDGEANWAPNEPNKSGHDGCVFISAKNESLWNNANCTTQLGFSCQKTAKRNFAATTLQPIDSLSTTFKPATKPPLIKIPERERSMFVTSQTTPTTTQRKTTANYVSRQVTYFVVIKTGIEKSGGTDANVHIFFRGSRGRTRSIYLDNARNNFEKGDLDTFSLRARDVGPLYSIQIRHDNTGEGPGWYIDYIKVRRYIEYGDMELDDSSHSANKVSYEEYFFPYYNWLARDEGDGRLYRDIWLSQRSVVWTN